MPGYLDTKAGRVGLVAADDDLQAWRAGRGAARRHDRRAGVNPVRFSTTYTVDAATMTALDQIGRSLGLAQDNCAGAAVVLQRHGVSGRYCRPAELPRRGLPSRRGIRPYHGRQQAGRRGQPAGDPRGAAAGRIGCCSRCTTTNTAPPGAPPRRRGWSWKMPAEFVIELSRAAIDAGGRRGGRARHARHAGDRDLQGEADLLQSRQPHPAERHDRDRARRGLWPFRPGHGCGRRPISSIPATATARAASPLIRSSGRR